MLVEAALTCTMCQKPTPPTALAQRPISGVCDECLFHLQAQSGMPLLDFLNGLEAPVLLVDGDVVGTGANDRLLALLGKKPEHVKGYRGGDVFECQHAALPGGCGRTVHCSGCAIRRAVTETFITGNSLKQVPAYLHRGGPQNPLRLGMRISTEKLWNVVLLRIDYLGAINESSQPDLPH